MRVSTYIRAVRYDLSESQPLKDETPEEHAAFLAEFKQLNLDGLYGFPLWEKELHDVLQKHFPELTKIFLAYTKSIGGSGSAEDAIEMDMSEFKDFVEECSLETREIDFAQMTIQFTKANAVNTAQVAQERMEGR